MTQPAAIAGSFADFRIVKTRKLVQVIIEIPIEQADEALAVLGGLPRSDRERHVAIARLNVSGRDANDKSSSGGHPSPTETRKDGSAPTDHRWSRKAAMLCQDRQFYDWLGVRGRPEAWQEDAARHLRDRLQITTRAELDVNFAARERFKTLLAEFEKDTGRAADPRR